MGLVGGIYRCGYQEVSVVIMYIGVVLRRYIGFLVLLIPTPLVIALFCISIPILLCSF